MAYKKVYVITLWVKGKQYVCNGSYAVFMITVGGKRNLKKDLIGEINLKCVLPSIL